MAGLSAHFHARSVPSKQKKLIRFRNGLTEFCVSKIILYNFLSEVDSTLLQWLQTECFPQLRPSDGTCQWDSEVNEGIFFVNTGEGRFKGNTKEKGHSQGLAIAWSHYQHQDRRGPGEKKMLSESWNWWETQKLLSLRHSAAAPPPACLQWTQAQGWVGRG